MEMIEIGDMRATEDGGSLLRERSIGYDRRGEGFVEHRQGKFAKSCVVQMVTAARSFFCSSWSAHKAAVVVARTAAMAVSSAIHAAPCSGLVVAPGRWEFSRAGLSCSQSQIDLR